MTTCVSNPSFIEPQMNPALSTTQHNQTGMWSLHFHFRKCAAIDILAITYIQQKAASHITILQHNKRSKKECPKLMIPCESVAATPLPVAQMLIAHWQQKPMALHQHGCRELKADKEDNGRQTGNASSRTAIYLSDCLFHLVEKDQKGGRVKLFKSLTWEAVSAYT